MALTKREREDLRRQLEQCNTGLNLLHSDLETKQREIAATEHNRNLIIAKLAVDSQMGAHPKARRDLIPLIKTLNPPPTVISRETNIMATQHQKISTHIEFLPTHTERFVTSGNDGIIKLWQLDPFRLNASNILSINALRNDLYPQDMSVNPNRENLVAAYGTPAGVGSQLVVVRLGEGVNERLRPVISTLHEEGIARVRFMPWKNDGHEVIVTSGNDRDHRLVFWKLGHDWGLNKSHKHHTSSIGGFCGLFQRHVVVSVGRDKKVISFDVDNNRLACNLWKMDAEGLSVIANPVDHNLVCVQTNAHKRQLRLYDMRDNEPLHEFGWTQVKTTKQSSSVCPEWGPNGLLLSSGSSDTSIHIFDIRFNKPDNPTNTFPVHHSPVYKAVWNPYRDALLSISSDRNIGFLRLSGDRLSTA